jgi:enoyl-CoA hydratase/carnithine racemase
MAEAVLFERVGDHVALVTLNRPEALNAMNIALMQALGESFRIIEGDKAIRCAVLTGAGTRAFSAGADLKEAARGLHNELNQAARGIDPLLMKQGRKPWIAAVSGFALGGGCELALACDMIVAGEAATFALPEVKRGVMATAGGVIHLPRAIPRAIAMEMIATGDPIDARRARELGLVNRVVETGRVLEEALAMAGRIAENAPFSVQESVAIARVAAADTPERAWGMAMKARAIVRSHPDALEGPRAFFEKRKPNWVD